MEDSLNIWILFQEGGPPQYSSLPRHYFLGKEFQKKGHNVTLFSGTNSHLLYNTKRLKKRYTVHDMEYLRQVWIRLPKYKNSTSKLRVLGWLIFAYELLFYSRFKSAGKPDVIIVSSMPLFQVIPAMFYKWRFGTRIVFEIRDIWPETAIQLGKFNKLNPFILLFRGLEKFSYRISDEIVTVLEKAHLHIEKSINKKVSVTWISNGISEEIAKKGLDPPEPVKEKIPIGKFIVGYAGAMGIANANKYLIEAAKILKDHQDIHFVLVGDGPEKEKLRKRARALNNVTFLPKVSKREVLGIIDHFSIAYVGFGKSKLYRYGIAANKIFDYYECGKPIIVTTSYEHRILSGKGSTTSIEPANPEALADAILKYYNLKPGELLALGDHNQIHVQNFYYSNLAVKYLEVINKSLT